MGCLSNSQFIEFLICELSRDQFMNNGLLLFRANLIGGKLVKQVAGFGCLDSVASGGSILGGCRWPLVSIKHQVLSISYAQVGFRLRPIRDSIKFISYETPSWSIFIGNGPN